jgi:hypothetical protein
VETLIGTVLPQLPLLLNPAMLLRVLLLSLPWLEVLLLTSLLFLPIRLEAEALLVRVDTFKLFQPTHRVDLVPRSRDTCRRFHPTLLNEDLAPATKDT